MLLFILVSARRNNFKKFQKLLYNTYNITSMYYYNNRLCILFFVFFVQRACDIITMNLSNNYITHIILPILILIYFVFFFSFLPPFIIIILLLYVYVYTFRYLVGSIMNCTEFVTSVIAGARTFNKLIFFFRPSQGTIAVFYFYFYVHTVQPAI